MNNISGRACSYERDSAICFRVSPRRRSTFHSVKMFRKVRAYRRHELITAERIAVGCPLRSLGTGGHHTVKLDVSTWPVYSRSVMTAIISSLSRAARDCAFTVLSPCRYKIAFNNCYKIGI